MFLNIVLLILIVFLCFYHASKLYTFYQGNDFVSTKEFINSFNNGFSITTIITIQNILRVIIILSLLLIVFRKKIGLITMWIGIGVLVISQFIIVSQSNSELIQSIHSGIKPLKGFILPTIITLLYKKTR